MNLLGVADDQPIPYGGAFIMEIYEHNGGLFVEVDHMVIAWLFI